MIINGIDISTFGGKVLDKSISPNRVNNSLNWDAINPQLLESKFDYKEVSITLLINAESEEDAISKISKLSEMFRLGAEIKFKDISYYLKCFILSKPDVTRLNHRNQYQVIFDCESEFGYKQGFKTIQGKNTTALQLVNEGNYPTPVGITLVPKSNSANLYVNGFIKNFTLTNVKAGDTLGVDGVSGEVSCNGLANINNFWGWNLPMIQAGNVTIKTNVPCDITVVYNERY